ncbi:hypothetical protein MATL_G00256890 [Megalops atlanticus]|uniref:NFX1-type zinc finger-containing protein 1 n=1 Tax=Megalops atlanticus TaxID=7932 RepID=A0A9D3PDG2_MEGAT|nr:hypothetical protein MATL_G00256890 [Megalops atlanticus]
MKKKLKNVVRQELRKTDHMLEEDAEQISDLWTLPYKQRWRLYRLWLSKYRSDIRTTILEYENEYQAIVNRIEELRNIEDQTVLKEASVIGMTTTCAARYRRVLQDIRPRIVVVEEAAEVLESHIITTLTPACQHLILIGDHQQLRPSATVYELARNFNLEVSLFERLIRMDVPYIRLDYQHRMRPEIARLLTPHIYDRLENHASVKLYENIKGVMTNVFFVEHKHLEESIHEGRSHQNMHEATFIKALCYYLLCQGYQPSQITVLTTYTGQLFCLKKIMPKSTFEGVNLCVVDRYQGEENDIVILSLVRSNQEGKTGFLKIPNRVCVALSRAKKALFCIGNMSMLSAVPLWSKIAGVLSYHGHLGEALTLRCENHPATVIAAAKAKDFLKAPLGGCMLPCDFRLPCGHVCTRLCHPSDAEHKEFKCAKPCAKTLCEDSHQCPKKCWQECGDCQAPVAKTIPKCGHEQEVPCSVDPKNFLCRVPCDKTLACGHMCVRACGETCTRNCPQKVTVDLDCGHQRAMLCHVKQDADRKGEKIRCWKKCGAELDCGHTCAGTCHDCAAGAAHLPCRSPCGARLVCSHPCRGRCGTLCVPCQQPCGSLCYHAKCQRLCFEACLPCTVPCGWRCKHYSCSRLCHEPCDRPPCGAPCHKKLKCGHGCVGMCGEPCPRKCRVCHAEEVQELFFGSEADPEARFVQLADCGHMFEVSGFDAWMAAPEADGAVRPKSCPKCSAPIRRSVRYNNIVKRVHADVEVAKGKAAAMWTESVQRAVKEREEKGIQSPEIPPLLSELSGSDFDVRKAMFIYRQIELLSKLAEMKHNAKLILPSLRHLQIKQAVDLCSKKIVTPESKGGSMSKHEREAERLLYLAEALALSEIYKKYRSSLKFPFLLQHPTLQGIIIKLENSELALNDQEVQNIQKSLDDVAKEIKPSTRWKMVEESNGLVLDCDFLKLNNWRKCIVGHTYYRPGADIDTNHDWCPECSVSVPE